MKPPLRRESADLSNWRAVRHWEAMTRQRLRQHHALWLHGWCIGLLVLGLMWGASHLQMVIGSDSLALRYLVTLGVGYLGFLLVLRWWAGTLVGERDGLQLDGSMDFSGGGPRVPEAGSTFRSGQGGDFGGGGAEASWDGVDVNAAGDGGSVIGDVASGALEAASGADEGIVVVIPVAIVFVIGSLVLLGFGSLLLLYFGWEVLLAVAVEIAFSYVSARTAVRIAREGWLPAAVRLTWKPLLGALACAVLLGAAIDIFMPTARSLPHAVELMRDR